MSSIRTRRKSNWAMEKNYFFFRCVTSVVLSLSNSSRIWKRLLHLYFSNDWWNLYTNFLMQKMYFSISNRKICNECLAYVINITYITSKNVNCTILNKDQIKSWISHRKTGFTLQNYSGYVLIVNLGKVDSLFYYSKWVCICSSDDTVNYTLMYILYGSLLILSFKLHIQIIFKESQNTFEI